MFGITDSNDYSNIETHHRAIADLVILHSYKIVVIELNKYESLFHKITVHKYLRWQVDVDGAK